ncbi:MAG: hypothetical protein M1826_005709 [Phylliscum demangeonii]|nr:MAG: hypothetical protein M1826_005709 [Phylliscum demangeonii]
METARSTLMAYFDYNAEHEMVESTEPPTHPPVGDDPAEKTISAPFSTSEGLQFIGTAVGLHPTTVQSSGPLRLQRSPVRIAGADWPLNRALDTIQRADLCMVVTARLCRMSTETHRWLTTPQAVDPWTMIFRAMLPTAPGHGSAFGQAITLRQADKATAFFVAYDCVPGLNHMRRKMESAREMS